LYTYIANSPVNYVDPGGLQRSLVIEEVKEYGRSWWKNVKEWWRLVKDVPYEAWPDAYRNYNRDFVFDAIEKLCSIVPGCFAINTEDPHWKPYFEPVPPKKPIDNADTENIRPDDPNEKVGPAGVGEQHMVSVDDELQYVIYFENKPEAGAPAQEVFITDYLDPDLDWSTFHLTEIAWGDHIISIPESRADFYTRQTVEDYREEVSKSWWVDIQVALNYETGRVRWVFRTLDPQTEDLPLDPLAGFLPPNDETGRGEGHVSFTIRPRADSPDGTVLTNKASIIFDTNDPIITNEVTNLIGQLKLYLPLILRSYTPPTGFPLYIGNAIPSHAAAYRGEVFYTTSVRIPNELPPGSHFYFSSQRDAVAKVLVDDELVVLLSGAKVFAHGFSTSGPPTSAIVEVPRTTMEQLAGRTITIEYRDVYGAAVGASTMWLIEVPG